VGGGGRKNTAVDQFPLTKQIGQMSSSFIKFLPSMTTDQEAQTICNLMPHIVRFVKEFMPVPDYALLPPIESEPDTLLRLLLASKKTDGKALMNFQFDKINTWAKGFLAMNVEMCMHRFLATGWAEAFIPAIEMAHRLAAIYQLADIKFNRVFWPYWCALRFSKFAEAKESNTVPNLTRVVEDCLPADEFSKINSFRGASRLQISSAAPKKSGFRHTPREDEDQEDDSEDERILHSSASTSRYTNSASQKSSVVRTVST